MIRTQSATPFTDLEATLPLGKVLESLKQEMLSVLSSTTPENARPNIAVLKRLLHLLDSVVGGDELPPHAFEPLPATVRTPQVKTSLPKQTSEVYFAFEDSSWLVKGGVDPRTGRRWKHRVHVDEIEPILSLLREQVSPLQPREVVRRSQFAPYKVYVLIGALAKLGLIAHEKRRSRYHSTQGDNFRYLKLNQVLTEIRSLQGPASH